MIIRREAVRSRVYLLVDEITFDAVRTTYESASVNCDKWKNFNLYWWLFRIASGVPQMEINVQVQWSPDNINWVNNVLGPYGSLVDSAGPNDSIGAGLDQNLPGGDVGGRFMKVVITATGTGVADIITLSLRTDFYN